MDSPPTKQQIIDLKSKYKIDLLREFLHVASNNSTHRCQHKFCENISERVTRLEINTNN